LTTVIVIRHAEKDVGADPSLTEKGQRRAKELVRVLGSVGIKAIYAANVKRAQQTAEPLQASLKLPKLLDASQAPDKLAKEVLEQHAGQTVLIIGQAPTIPGILQAFGVDAAEGRGVALAFDNLFILQARASAKTKLLKLKYGESSP
jgi:broad specificity phosphatase PhoE